MGRLTIEFPYKSPLIQELRPFFIAKKFSNIIERLSTSVSLMVKFLFIHIT